MRCYNCGSPLSEYNYCVSCGADVKYYKKMIYMSNRYYNLGLDKARVRDLSGAIESLRHSLKYNKNNVQARNLLGLCYCEIGEVVSALREWIISRSIQKDRNIAEVYLNDIQSRQSKLNSMNMAIRKYNMTLTYCQQGSYDLAEIQLKKIVSSGCKLLKSYMLLALLLMRKEEYEKARKLLTQVLKIDCRNIHALRYMEECKQAQGYTENEKKKKREKADKDRIAYVSGNETIIQPASYKESSGIFSVINVLIGLILGAALVWFLIVPAKVQSLNNDANSKVNNYNEQITLKDDTISSLEAQIKKLETTTEEANQTAQEANAKAEGYEELLKACETFLNGDEPGAINQVEAIDETQLPKDALNLYKSLRLAVNKNRVDELDREGDRAYREEQYATAISNYEQVLELDESQHETLYYLTYAYQRSGNNSKAYECSKRYVENFPNGSHYSSMERMMNSLAGSAGQGETDPGVTDPDPGVTDPEPGLTDPDPAL